jgi:multidrug transporter EmrE-like cation transporter
VTGDPRLVRALVACYPARWRDRYGDEYAQVLCDMDVGRRPLLILDSLRGAVRAHGGVLMSKRSPMTVAVWAAGLFTVAGIGFQKVAEDFTGVAGGIYALVVAAAAVALLALAVAALPTAVALVRGRGLGAWKYLAVPVVGVAVWYGVVRFARAISGHGAHSAGTVAGFVLVAAVGIAVVAATAWAAVRVLNGSPEAEPARLRPVALPLVAAGMAVTTVAALVWGLRVRSADPAGFRGTHGILATPFVPSWVAAVVLMAAATALAATAGRRQLAALR